MQYNLVNTKEISSDLPTICSLKSTSVMFLPSSPHLSFFDTVLHLLRGGESSSVYGYIHLTSTCYGLCSAGKTGSRRLDSADPDYGCEGRGALLPIMLFALSMAVSCTKRRRRRVKKRGKGRKEKGREGKGREGMGCRKRMQG